MSGSLVKELEYTKAAKSGFSEAAKYELRKLHEKYGGNNTYDEYVKLLQNLIRKPVEYGRLIFL